MANKYAAIIKNLIKNEDKFNPWTDEEIADQISVLRETVTTVRKEEGIPDSRGRRKELLIRMISMIKKEDPNITVAKLTEKLGEEGFSISRNTVSNTLSNLEDYLNEMKSVTQNKSNPFEKLIGHGGSLAKCIKQAKASIMYPPLGLSTLIIGESGTGKTFFVDCMYQYAVQKNMVSPDAPFISFNCADYGDNPQLLLSVLYGYKKGTFTGADNDTSGLVEHANGGILFLDEVHRLPAKGQEILFSLLDKGKFRRLGETFSEREVQVLIIAATTENVESSLLLSFRRRIPMLIKVPNLQERNIEERLEIINRFFQEECNRINLNIFVAGKILEMLLIKHYKGNIGQLKSEIKVICANAYVENINNKSAEIKIGFNEILHDSSFSGSSNIDDASFSKIKALATSRIFIPNINENPELVVSTRDNKYSLPEDIYQQIEEKYYELKETQIDPEEMKKILWTFVLNAFKKMGHKFPNQTSAISWDEIKDLVDARIIKILRDFRKHLKKNCETSSINEKIFIHLAIHLNEAIKRIGYKQLIINPNLTQIKNELKEEYALAKKLATKLEQDFAVIVPTDEIGFMAMYINAILHKQKHEGRIALIVLCHGMVATELVKVVNRLLNIDFPIAIDMPLDMSPCEVFKKTIEIAKIVDDESGILFLVDMGSLKDIGNIVEQRTGIRTRVIDRVDLLTVIEAARKIYLSEGNLDEIYYDLINTKCSYPFMTKASSDKPTALITSCLSGQGMALRIKDILKKRYANVTIIPLGIADEELRQKVNNLKEKYNIVGILGTVNPKIEGINFIPFADELLSNKKMVLDQLFFKTSQPTFEKMIKKEFILLNCQVSSKQEVLERMCLLLYNQGYIKREYFNSLLNREKMNSTYFKGGLAIPHGLPVYVDKSAFVFVKTKEPLVWDREKRKVDLICLFAVKDSDTEVINRLFKVLKNRETIKELKQAQTQAEFLEIITKH